VNDGQAVLLADIQRPIALFAQGLYGHFLHLKPIEPAAREAAGADGENQHGESIELPACIGQFQTRSHNLGAYRIAVLRQIGYLADGAADFTLDGARKRMSVLPSAPSAPDLSELERFLALGSRPALLRRMFLTLEGARIDGLIAQRYPGAAADLARVRARARAQRPNTVAANAVVKAVESLILYSLGGERSGLPGEWLALVDSVLAAGADVYDSACSAVALCRAIDARFHLRARTGLQSADAAPADDAQESEYFSAPPDVASLGLDFSAELAVKIVGARHHRGGQVGGLQSLSSRVITSGTPETSAQEVKSPDGGEPARALAAALPQEPSRSYLYDEWDYHTRAYLRAWCRLYEKRLRGERFDFIDDVHRRHALLAEQVRRQFGFIRPEQWHRVRRTNDGDELELDGVIEAVIDRRVAGASDSKLYVRRDRALRDVAAAFLMDMSASTGFPLPAPTAAGSASDAPAEYAPYFYGGVDDIPPVAAQPKRRVIDVAKDALALMCEALRRLGDSCAIYGFSGDGREQVEFLVAKDFRDRLSAQTWAALAAMEPLRSTRMGTAIRHALVKLLREPARMKVLVIVSDGYPQDHDYGPDRRDDSYGIEDTACALREAERAGVIAFCVTIDPAGHDYLRRMCADSRYMVIDDVMALPRELTKIYRTLTA
jgi:nitric oxide reductase NorD protein